ncbi:hypothetical protein EDD36DRAFT_154202 [Exophiala viscosa]|uniref:BZIP domain-containing protein n=1 Tax=Exophiala viscosa TaxID=2486360 RepID=A0AAN6E2T5_9EURO|nr:hypothetical protein EDD36DRAFT_154202 [Exophiala viscosa]
MVSGEEPASGALNVAMMRHAEARSVNEIWAGKTDIKERRRLQNRLNRRAYRKRQTEQNRMRDSHPDRDIPQQARRSRFPGVHVFSVAGASDARWHESISLNAFFTPSKAVLHKSEQMSTSLNPLRGWCRRFEETWLQSGLSGIELGRIPSPEHAENVSDAVICEEHLLSFLNIQNPHPLPMDHLINLVYYNVFRGLSKNIKHLRLDCLQMLFDDCPSPFIAGGLDISVIAPDFHPTLLQRTVPHHPCFDIFPDAVVRDNAINCWRGHESAHQGRLCFTIAGRNTWHEIDIPLRHGFVLWEQPDCVESWEVTEGFVQDWPCLVKGAFRLEAATNSWRGVRGEPPISFA